jgi:hypothetical protein
MDGYEEYQAAVIKVIRPIIEPKTDEERDAFHAAFRNHLFDLEGPRQIDSGYTRDELLIGNIFRGFVEISDAYLSLRDVEVYVRRFPYRDAGISEVRHLKYHIENYLNEVYILKERLIAYLNFLTKRYRKGKSRRRVTEGLEPLYSAVSETFGNVVDTRGSHVHASRFSDLGLDRLSTLEFLKTAGGDDMWPLFFKYEYKKIRKKRAATIQSNNDVTKAFLDFYFGWIHQRLFTQQGDLRFPE